MEMSPRALARAISVAMPATSNAEPSTAGHAARDHVNAWPETAKKASHASVASDWVHATMTIGGIARARPLTTANWAACVSVAPSECRNQLRSARPNASEDGEADARAEAAGAAHGHGLAEMGGWMEQRNAAQHGGAWPAGKALHHLLGAAAERALGRGRLERLRRQLAAPVGVLEAGDDLARAPADGVAILAQRGQIDRARELGDFRARHADPEVAARHAEPLGPRVVEDLRPARNQPIDDDVFGARDVPHQPRERVQVLTRPHTHLRVADAAERALGRGDGVAAHRDRLHRRMLREKELLGVHSFSSVGCGHHGVTGGGICDVVVVVGRDRPAHADGADDAAGVDERHTALAEHELILAERGNVVREQHALREALLEIARGRAKAGRRVRLGPRDLGRHPERAVHALAHDQVSRLIDHGDGDLETQLLRALEAALDARAREIARDRAHDRSTQISSFSRRTGYVGTDAPRPGNTHWPVRTSYIQPRHGHASRAPDSLPSLSGPPLCAQTSARACTWSPMRTSTTRVAPASTSLGCPTVTSASAATRIAVTAPLSGRTRDAGRSCTASASRSPAAPAPAPARACRACPSGVPRSGSRARRAPRRLRCGSRRTPPRGR